MARINDPAKPSKQAQFIRANRESRQWTQTQLAKRANIPQPDISAIEAGTLTIGEVRARRIAKAFRISYKAIVGLPAGKKIANGPKRPRRARQLPLKFPDSPSTTGEVAQPGSVLEPLPVSSLSDASPLTPEASALFQGADVPPTLARTGTSAPNPTAHETTTKE